MERLFTQIFLEEMLTHLINNKMKYVFFIISLILFGSIHSQKVLFITPSVNTKINVFSTNWDNFSTKLPQNEYFDIFSNNFHTSPFIGFGLKLGFKETNKFSLDISWNIDISSTSATEVYLTNSSSGANNYFNQNLTNKSGLDIHRFSLNYTKQILDKNLFFIVGAGFLFSPSGLKKGDSEPYSYEFGFAPFQNDENITIERNYKVYANNRYSLNLSFGLGYDFRLNDNYLFTIEAIYSQGFKNINTSSYSYTIIDDDIGETKTYRYGLFSRGSGITLQLSRKFHLFRLKKDDCKNAHNIK